MYYSYEDLSLEQVKERYGNWSAMAVKLQNGEYTREPAVDFRLKRLLQIARDVVKKPLEECRVLDLACLEGHYGIEFALHGAEVVAIEAREANLAKAAYVKSNLGLEKLKLILGDVRDLSPKKHGQFDIVICSGILYHLTLNDACEFLRNIYNVCDGIVLIDTYVAMSADLSADVNGTLISGIQYKEHDEAADANKKLKDLWASIDNTTSFWLTEPSLINYLNEIGFTSVLEVHSPVMPSKSLDRKTYVAIKGERIQIQSSEMTDNQQHVDVSEGDKGMLHPTNVKRGTVFLLAKQLLPASIKDMIKPILRLLRILPPDKTQKF